MMLTKESEVSDKFEQNMSRNKEENRKRKKDLEKLLQVRLSGVALPVSTYAPVLYRIMFDVRME